MLENTTGKASAICIFYELELWRILRTYSPLASVPLPNSSMINRLRRVAKLKANEICWISIMKALSILATDSLVLMRVKILSVIPIFARSAGTKLFQSIQECYEQEDWSHDPMCAIYTMSATCFRYTLLPE